MMLFKLTAWQLYWNFLGWRNSMTSRNTMPHHHNQQNLQKKKFGCTTLCLRFWINLSWVTWMLLPSSRRKVYIFICYTVFIRTANVKKATRNIGGCNFRSPTYCIPTLLLLQISVLQTFLPQTQCRFLMLNGRLYSLLFS